MTPSASFTRGKRSSFFEFRFFLSSWEFVSKIEIKIKIKITIKNVIKTDLGIERYLFFSLSGSIIVPLYTFATLSTPFSLFL